MQPHACERGVLELLRPHPVGRFSDPSLALTHGYDPGSATMVLVPVRRLRVRVWRLGKWGGLMSGKLTWKVEEEAIGVLVRMEEVGLIGE